MIKLTEQQWKILKNNGYDNWPESTQQHAIEVMAGGEPCPDLDCEIHNPPENESRFRDPADPDVPVTEAPPIPDSLKVEYLCEGKINALAVRFRDDEMTYFKLGERHVHMTEGDHTSPIIGKEWMSWRLGCVPHTASDPYSRRAPHIIIYSDLRGGDLGEAVKDVWNAQRSAKPMYVPLSSVHVYQEVHSHNRDCISDEMAVMLETRMAMQHEQHSLHSILDRLFRER